MRDRVSKRDILEVVTFCMYLIQKQFVDIIFNGQVRGELKKGEE
jgi:hypothetical protein